MLNSSSFIFLLSLQITFLVNIRNYFFFFGNSRSRAHKYFYLDAPQNSSIQRLVVFVNPFVYLETKGCTLKTINYCLVHTGILINCGIWRRHQSKLGKNGSVHSAQCLYLIILCWYYKSKIKFVVLFHSFIGTTVYYHLFLYLTIQCIDVHILCYRINDSLKMAPK